MKPATGIGIGVATSGSCWRDDGGHQPAAFIDIPALHHHPRRHRRRHDGERRHGGDEADPRRSTSSSSTLSRPTCRAASTLLVSLAEQARREGLLALDAAGRARSTTSSPARACSSSSTASTRISCARSWRPRSTAWSARHHVGAATVREGRRLRPDDGHHRHRHGARPRAPEPVGAVDARPGDLQRVHRHADGRRHAPTSIYLPVANRLKALSAAEVELRTLTLDGILAVQAGDNPRVVAEKLNSYIAPAERLTGRGQGRDGRRQRSASAEAA